MGRFEEAAEEAEAGAEEAEEEEEEEEEEEDPAPVPRSTFRRDRRIASSRFASGLVSGALAAVAAAERLYPGTRLHEILINLDSNV